VSASSRGPTSSTPHSTPASSSRRSTSTPRSLERRDRDEPRERGPRRACECSPSLRESSARSPTPQTPQPVSPRCDSSWRTSRRSPPPVWSSSCTTCATPATRARSFARPTPPAPRRWSSPASRSIPSTPRRFARRPVRSFTCRCASVTSTTLEHFADVGRGYATVVRGGRDFRDVDFTTASVVVIGNEAEGLGDAAVAACHSISIPMAGRGESLNAGVAASLIAFEALWQRQGAISAPRHPVAFKSHDPHHSPTWPIRRPSCWP
jgi:hypothetical protein